MDDGAARIEIERLSILVDRQSVHFLGRVRGAALHRYIRLQSLVILGYGELLALRQRGAQSLQRLVTRVLGVIDSRQVQVCVGP